MKKLDMAAALFVLMGAFNWGLVGVFDFNLVETLFENTISDRVFYGLFGLSSIYAVVNWRSVTERLAKAGAKKK